MIGAGKNVPKRVCSPVDFKTADLVPAGDRVVLKVTGEAPHEGLTIDISAVLYVMQPDYWQMVLVACHPEGTTPSGPPVTFTADINISGTIGRKGIELSGRPGSKPRRLDLPE